METTDSVYPIFGDNEFVFLHNGTTEMAQTLQRQPYCSIHALLYLFFAISLVLGAVVGELRRTDAKTALVVF